LPVAARGRTRQCGVDERRHDVNVLRLLGIEADRLGDLEERRDDVDVLRLLGFEVDRLGDLEDV